MLERPCLESKGNLVLFQKKLALLNNMANWPGLDIVLLQYSSYSVLFWCLFRAWMLIHGAKLHHMLMLTKQNLPHCLYRYLGAVHHYLFSRASVFCVTFSVLADDVGCSFS